MLLRSNHPGEMHDYRRDFLFSTATRDPGCLFQISNFSPHKTDSGGECAMDQVSEQPSGQQEGGG